MALPAVQTLTALSNTPDLGLRCLRAFQETAERGSIEGHHLKRGLRPHCRDAASWDRNLREEALRPQRAGVLREAARERPRWRYRRSRRSRPSATRLTSAFVACELSKRRLNAARSRAITSSAVFARTVAMRGASFRSPTSPK